jgi:hypothetical protein
MADTCYPVFQEGQTLTRDDLTLMQQFFDERARAVGRAIGFGIDCGLDGEITTTGGVAAVIDAGIAIDQDGEVLTLETPVHIPLPPAATATGFNFIKENAGGFTVVLMADESVTPAPACNEVGCEGHAATACRTAELVLVPGQLIGTFFDFESEDLIQKVTPLTAAPTAKQFDDLKAAILKRLDTTLSAAAKAKLTSVSIATADLPAIKNAKAAFLNQVLFAALDLLRCRALLELQCLRTVPKAGVALGWAHQVGAKWEWDCSFRHAWEPPAGLSIALVGGACEDACQEHRDRLESLILTFDLPPVPKPEDPPKGGGESGDPYTPCQKVKKGSKGYYFSLEDCGLIYVPPKELPHDWHIGWTKLPKGYPPHVAATPVWDVYLTPELDYFGEGMMVLTDAIGRDPEKAKTGITNAVKDAHVEVLTLDAAQKQPGFTLAAVASPADTIVLIKDAIGKVVDIGTVPAQTGFRNASVAIPAATAAATAAKQIAEGMQATVDKHGQTLSTLEGEVADFDKFRNEAQGKLKTADDVFRGLDAHISDKAKQVYSQFQTETAVFLHNAVTTAVEDVRGGIEAQMEKTAELHTAEIKEEFTRVDERAQQASEAASRANTRVDQVLTGKAVGLTDREIGRQTAFNEDLVNVMRDVTVAVEAAAPDAQKAAVRDQLAPGKDALSRMEAGVRAGSLVLEDEKAPLTQLLDTFVNALKAAGAPAAQLKQLQLAVRALQEKLQ